MKIISWNLLHRAGATLDELIDEAASISLEIRENEGEVCLT